MDCLKKYFSFIYLKLLLLQLLIAPGILIADASLPVGHNLNELTYELYYQIAISNQKIDKIPITGPLAVSRFTNRPDLKFHSAIKLYHTDDYHTLRLWSLSGQRYLSGNFQTGRDLPYLTGGATFQPSEYFSGQSSFRLDRALAIDPDYSGKKYRGLAGDLETAAIYFRKGKFAATMGRQKVFWGPQPVNLLLSETAEPFDLLSASYNTGRLTFNFLFARLDGSRPNETDSIRYPTATFNDNRYLSAHRLDIKFHRRLRIGFFETMLFGGEGRPPELYYLNPLQFFHSAQLNENQDDNSILGFDFVFLPGKRSMIYGQLLVDDFQVDNSSQGDQEPNEIGIMVGVIKSGRVGSFRPDLKAEYVRITNRTYNQREPRNRYLYRNRPIGHPLGNDADSISLQVRFWPFAEADFAIGLETAYRRRGEGSILNPWDEPWATVVGEYSEPFPTGVVEKSLLFALRSKGYLPFTEYTRRHLFLTLDAGWGKVKNSANQIGIDRTDSHFDISLSWLGYIDFDTEK